MAKDTIFTPTQTITLKGEIHDLDKPRIMGILNLTPDSFYDGGRYKNADEITFQVDKMLAEGAFIIDIGGCSSRPGSDLTSEAEEIKRVVPVVEFLLKKFPEILISVDTFRAEVARLAIEGGACMINDISGGRWEPEILNVVKKTNSAYVLMHSRGNFDELHRKENYENGISTVLKELSDSIQKMNQKGITNLIIDPGFGFSKNVEQNFEMMAHLEQFKLANLPLLAGISRKSMIWKTLKTDADSALNGTTALNMVCLLKGAKILRVHDVKEAMETINLYSKINEYGKERQTY